MACLIDKDAVVAKIERLKDNAHNGVSYHQSRQNVGLNNELSTWEHLESAFATILKIIDTLEVKEVGVWKTVDNINPPQADRNKIYCVFTKQRYILAKVIDHPQDDGLLQWKCTEFPNHRYDMCEGDKYMQIV